MKQILYLVIASTILFTSCTNDVAGTSDVFTNPLDPVTAEEEGFLTPAVVFFPSTATTSVGGGVTLDIHAMEVDSIAGSHIQVSYNKAKLALLNLSQGSFYEGAPEMLFYYEDDTNLGLIISILGSWVWIRHLFPVRGSWPAWCLPQFLPGYRLLLLPY